MLEGWVTSGKKGNRVKQKQDIYHQFITFCHARGKRNIDWRVIPTAANRIMMLIVSWRVCLFFNLELFVLGYLTYLLNNHLTLSHSSALYKQVLLILPYGLHRKEAEALKMH